MKCFEKLAIGLYKNGKRFPFCKTPNRLEKLVTVTSQETQDSPGNRDRRGLKIPHHAGKVVTVTS